MKWITRENAKVDRIACPWLIRRFVDPDAVFLFVPADQVAAVAAAERESLRRVKEKKATRRREGQVDENRTALRDLRRRVETAEKEIETLEAKIAQLTAVLEDPELYTTREGATKSSLAGKQLEDAKRKLDIAFAAWTEANEQVEQLTAT